MITGNTKWRREDKRMVRGTENSSELFNWATSVSSRKKKETFLGKEKCGVVTSD